MLIENVGPAGKTYYTISDDIAVWVEDDSSIQLKAISPFGDPVDLGEGEVQDLINVLQKLLQQIR